MASPSQNKEVVIPEVIYGAVEIGPDGYARHESCPIPLYRVEQLIGDVGLKYIVGFGPRTDDTPRDTEAEVIIIADSHEVSGLHVPAA